MLEEPHFWIDLILKHLLAITLVDNLRRWPLTATVGKIVLPKATTSVRDKHSNFSRSQVKRSALADIQEDWRDGTDKGIQSFGKPVVKKRFSDQHCRTCQRRRGLAGRDDRSLLYTDVSSFVLGTIGASSRKGSLWETELLAERPQLRSSRP